MQRLFPKQEVVNLKPVYTGQLLILISFLFPRLLQTPTYFSERLLLLAPPYRHPVIVGVSMPLVTPKVDKEHLRLEVVEVKILICLTEIHLNDGLLDMLLR